MGNPLNILNLDDLETPESDIQIVHQGTAHKMRVLDVDQFIEQQKRAKRQQQMADEAEKVGDKEMVEVVELIRDSIVEFFPTLPVGQLPTAKLFMIFGWLNELTAKVNALAAPTEGEGVSSAEGNEPEVEAQS